MELLAVFLAFVLVAGILMLLIWLAIRGTKWDVVLKDGTKFVGKRTFGCLWQEGFLEVAYEVIDSPSLPKGSRVNISYGSTLYRIKQKEIT